MVADRGAAVPNSPPLEFKRVGLIKSIFGRSASKGAQSGETLASLEQTAAMAPGEAGADTSHESVALAIQQAHGNNWGSELQAVHDSFKYAAALRSGTMPGMPAGFDYKKLQELQTSMMDVMRQHGIDPMRPDPSKFSDPAFVQAMQQAASQAGFGVYGTGFTPPPAGPQSSSST
jgi:hypothetical protein